jgi:hypothetical protein
MDHDHVRPPLTGQSSKDAVKHTKPATADDAAAEGIVRTNSLGIVTPAQAVPDLEIEHRQRPSAESLRLSRYHICPQIDPGLRAINL